MIISGQFNSSTTGVSVNKTHSSEEDDSWTDRLAKHQISDLDSLWGSSVKIGTQRRLAWPLRKDDTHKTPNQWLAKPLRATKPAKDTSRQPGRDKRACEMLRTFISTSKLATVILFQR